MAASTIRDVLDALLAMPALGLRRLVFVAARTGIGQVIARMTDLASNIACAAVIQRKGMVAETCG